MHSQPKATKGQAKKTRSNPMPFCPVPRALLRDPELTAVDKVIAGLIMPWLGEHPSGFVLNSILARDAIVDPRSVPRSLRRLEASLWFRCEDGPGYRGHRKITALWRTADGRKAIKARLKALDVPIGDDPAVMRRVTVESPEGRRGLKKEGKQRIQLSPEQNKSSLASVPVVPDADDDCQTESRRKMVELARELSRLSEHDDRTRDVVDRFADMSVSVVWDTNSNRKVHCGFGLALVRGMLTPIDVQIVVGEFAEKFDQHELLNPPGWYVNRMQTRMRFDTDESLEN